MKTQIVQISKEECIEYIKYLPFNFLKSNLEDIKEDSTHCYCAILSGRIAGIHTIQCWPGRVYLELYEVLPNFRGHKLQKQLTEFSLMSLNPKKGTKVSAFCITYPSYRSLMRTSLDFPEYEWDIESSTHLRNIFTGCSKCMSLLSENDVFCYRCGIPQKCPHCGERIPYPNPNYCPHCGKEVKSDNR